MVNEILHRTYLSLAQLDHHRQISLPPTPVKPQPERVVLVFRVSTLRRDVFLTACCFPRVLQVE